jgi:uncharacterized protein (DUF1697 family)
MKYKSDQPVMHVALLRGINVGGKNKLPMRDLAEMFVAAKCSEVKTFIQSGNVIFEATPKISAQIPEIITAQITNRFGHKIPVVLRTKEEFADAISNNPFLKAGTNEEMLYMMFLADMPSAENIAKLDAKRSPPDEFVVRSREIFLRLPNGGARSKLTNAYFDSKLKTVSTARNWRTVTKLLELLGT